MPETSLQLDEQMKERFAELPKVVQDSITSASVQKHLQELARTHKLHLDQWTTLENEVMLVLLGLIPTTELQSNIQSELNIDTATATALAADISRVVFEPIRQELERQLDHPDAKAVVTSGADQMREQMLVQNTTNAAISAPITAQKSISPTSSVAPMPPTPIAPGTPPNAPVSAPVERAVISETYKPGVASTDRKTVHDDPYRESPV